MLVRHLKVAKWLVKDHAVDVHYRNDMAFKKACSHDQLEIAKWLAEEHAVDVNVNSKITFQNACFGGYLEIAKWLVEDHAVDVHADNEAAFGYACKYGKKNIISWFEQELGSSMRYFCHNRQAYIINHEPIPGWHHRDVLGCPILYQDDFDETAIIDKLATIRSVKSARSAKI